MASISRQHTSQLEEGEPKDKFWRSVII